MSIREKETQPETLSHFPATYRWLELHDQDGVYGYSAIMERDDNLETHLSLERWGPGVRRSLHGDLEWLKREARRLGKTKILGIRVNTDGEFDPNLFRFARLYGARNMHVFQTVSLNVD